MGSHMYLSQFLEVSAGRLHESIRLDEDILIHGFFSFERDKRRNYFLVEV